MGTTTNLFRIIESNTEGERLIFSLEINDVHDIFKGHFPGQAVLPGVCLIQMIKDCVKLKFPEFPRLLSAKQIKFPGSYIPHPSGMLTITFKGVGEKDNVLNVSGSAYENEDNPVCKFNLRFGQDHVE